MKRKYAVKHSADEEYHLKAITQSETDELIKSGEYTIIPLADEYYRDDDWLYILQKDDARMIAERMGIDPDKLTDDHFRQIQKGLESGLEFWSEVMETAIECAVEDYPIEE